MNKLAILFLISFYSLSVSSAEWKSNCPDAPDGCQNVGKTAYNNAHWLKPGKIRDNIESVLLGNITGVIWRPTGSLVGYSPAIPSHNIPENIRVSDSDSWYYIIDDGTDQGAFISKMRDIKAK